MSASSTFKSLLIISIFTALVFGTAESYTCTRCLLEECDSQPQTCETSQGCLSSKQEFNESGVVRRIFLQEKSCASSGCENLAFSATLGADWSFGYESRCCQSEQCNKENFYLTEKSSTPNGVVCPACYNEKDLSCNSVSLQCTGAEKKCIEVTGTGNSRLSFFGKGCATETACSLSTTVFHNIQIKTKCHETNSGSLPPNSIISLILTTVFPLKALL